MTCEQIVDLYFIEARSKLIDIAAFLDRAQRAEGNDDFRIRAFKRALNELVKGEDQKAKRVLLTFSDPTTDPLEHAAGKGALGAFNETSR
jgi:hypothetical protein